MSDQFRKREVIVVVFMLTSLLSAMFWAWCQAGVFCRQCPPRFASFKIWPDARVIREKAKIERVNIHIPNFGQLAKALSAPERGDVWEPCVTYHRNVIEAMPGRHDAWLAKGVCEYYIGDLPEAERSLMASSAIKTDLFWVHYDLGMLYYNNGAYEPAVKELKQAIERGRTYNGREWLGSKIISDIVRADERLDPARSFSLAYLDTFKALAASCMLLNDLSCAKDLSEAGSRLNPRDEDFLVILGGALLRSGNVAGAIEPLKEAIKLYPSSGAAYFFLGVALKAAKNESSSLLSLQKSKELGFEPDHFLSKLKFPLRIY